MRQTGATTTGQELEWEFTLTIGRPFDGELITIQSLPAPLTVSGTLEILNVIVDAVDVQMGDGGPWQPAEVDADGPQVRQWFLDTQVTASGPLRISVRAIGHTILGDDKFANRSISVTVGDITPPALTVTTPDLTVPGDGRVSRVPITVSASDSLSGIRTVEWLLDGVVQITETFQTPCPATWSGTRDVLIPASAAPSHSIVVRCFDGSGNRAERPLTIATPDATPPFWEIIEPKDGAAIPGSPTGAVITLSGTAEDRQSGVRAVDWSLDGGKTFTQAKSTDGWQHWHDQITIQPPAYGSYVLTLRVRDNADKQRTETLHVDVARPFTPRTPEELIDVRAYLEDLVWFGGNHVVTPAQPLTVQALERAFHQPFERLTDPLAAWGDQPLSQTRIAIEVLRKHLALGGHWRFEEDGGTVARDASGCGNDATLVNGPTWTAGRLGRALSFNGTSRADVAHAASLDVGRDGADFTVAFWLNVATPATGKWRRIVAKSHSDTAADGRAFALFMHASTNQLHYCISTTTSANEHGFSVKTVPVNVWTHVACVKAGQQLQLYVNGTLDSVVTLTGQSRGNTSAVYLGNVGWTSAASFAGLDGSLDDVRIYQRRLSASEIVELYAVPARGVETVWVDDLLPTGAVTPPVSGGTEAWTWVQTNPTPMSGAKAHQSALMTGTHQHFFGEATQTLAVGRGDRLFAHVHLDPANPPRTVMLQWNDGTWEHRAYWGSESILWGSPGTESRRYMGPLPPAGQWVRLEVPAKLVGLERRVVTGMAFTLHDGRATWDRAGKTSTAAVAVDLPLAESGYRGAAYAALLNRLGTSLEELRLARGADEAARKALATRLGLDLDPTPPDQLDRLRLSAGQTTEANLESLFGLVDTRRAPWQAASEPDLLKWQLAHLRTVWRQDDHQPLAEAPDRLPIVDPDLVGPDDLTSPVPGNAAFDLRQARAAWVLDRIREIRDARQAEPTPVRGLDRILADTFGPRGHWRLDEGSGTTAADSSGYLNPGTLNGPTWTAGKIGSGALTFDGDDDVVRVASAASLVLTTAGSISAWIRPLGPGTSSVGGAIVSKESEYALARFPDGTIRWSFANADPGWGWRDTGVIAPENTWTHVALVYDAGRVATYANGSLVHTHAGAGTIGDQDPQRNELRIGGREGVAQHFHGLIDDVRVHDRALNADEVAALCGLGAIEPLALADLARQGHAIDTALRGLYLTPESFARLLRLRALALQDAVTDAEWDEAYDILAQVKKVRARPRWRAEEGSLTLSPDHFKLWPAAAPGPTWRALASARRDWQDVLRARIEQDAAVRQALRDAVQAVEETTLPLLRDAYVAAIGVQEGRADAGDWLTDQVLIDAKGGGARRTTRRQQAIETLQSVFFSLRTGRFEGDHGAATWGFVTTDTAAQLDEEWAWMGTHAAWAAAMQIFHYPENVLLPSLRGEGERTPEFAGLLRAARSTPRLTPQGARELAAGYLDGLRGARIGHWRLSEPAGAATASDSSGNRNDGALAGGAAFVDQAGRRALSLDGVDDSVTIDNAPLLEVGKDGADFTVAFWIFLRRTRTGGWRTILHKGETNAERTVALWMPPTTDQIRYAVSTTVAADEGGDSVAQIALNVWTHVACVKAGATLSLYINGKLDSSVALKGTSVSNAGPLRLGKDPWAQGVDACLSDVQLYDQALSKDGVTRIHGSLYGSRLPAELDRPFVLTDQLSEDALKQRRTLVTTLLTPYVDATQTPNRLKGEMPPYLSEVFYFVPVQLALLLQKSGQYVAALDWLHTVYAYNLPAQPKIYYGLELEQNVAPALSRPPHWLRQSLQPHALAAGRPNAYTRYTLLSLVRCFIEFADAEFARDTAQSVANARSLYLTARRLLASPDLEPPRSSGGAVLVNPIQGMLAVRVELQLAKLRQGRNIAGMKRQLEPLAPAAAPLPVGGNGGSVPRTPPADLRPTPYRYGTLIERSRQLVGLAQQMEAAYLAALEKRDAEHYTLQKAGYDLELARAGVTLQGLRLTEAQGAKTLADLQKERVVVQQTTYQGWIETGLNPWELTMIASYLAGGLARGVSAVFDALAQVAQASMSMASSSNPIGAIGSAAVMAPYIGAVSNRAAAQGFAILADTAAQVASVQASYERRKQEWELQKSLADKDFAIAGQQIQTALDHVAVVEQEQAVAGTQARHATAMADFLARKFTSAELYEWMSDVLSGVYGYFLQQATAIARLAEQQLAFERQAASPGFVQADYWEPPSETGGAGAAGAATPDRRGLTGSARLLQDIVQLDQYAFETSKRKLNLTQTFSLARLAPFEFQRFRETGVLPFATPMRLFDEAFPGHYLRLIRRVRTSVVALIPPTQGIRATLSTPGISRVVVEDQGTFRETVVRRDPEMVALTSPVNATGVFELDMQSEMLLPFESTGVDTTWDLSMPPAGNAFDYRTIADVLLTIDYTALPSLDYRQQVIKTLDQRVSGDRPYSFRDLFPDAWYDLHNSDQTARPMTVRFKTTREDFPPNVESLRIQHVLLYFARAAGGGFEVPVSGLSFTEQGKPGAVGGAATSIDAVISTRRGNAAAWTAMIGRTPVGEWELALPDTTEMKNRFAADDIQDIVFAITFSGRTPPWPA